MNVRNLLLSVFVASVGVLAFVAAPALAAAPETPETLKAESVSESGATLRGVLNPGKAGGPGLFEINSYEFVYNKASAGECTGGFKSEPEGMSLGGGMEHVAQAVTGLEAHTKYLVCLVADNGAEAVGAPVSFVTVPVEAPAQDEVVAVTGSSAELKGVLDSQAKSEGETGSYVFRYSSSGRECEVPGATLTAGEGEMTGEPKQAVSVVAGLQPDTTYTFCLVALQPGEEAKGSPVTFKTADLAPVISGEGVTSVGSSEAAVEAQIVPGAPPAKYHVEYGTSTAYGTSTPAVGLGTGTSAVRVIVRLGGLHPATEYHYRFVAENEAEAGERDGVDQTFTTASSVSGSTSALPDNRVYELVSSATENVTVDDNSMGIGEELASDTACDAGKEHAAAGGDALAYEGEPSTTTGDGQLGDGLCNQWIAVRGPTGWTATDVTPNEGDTEAEKLLVPSLYDLVGGPLNWSNPLPEGRPEPTSEAFVGGPPEKVNGGERSPDFTHAISADGSRIYWTSVEVGREERYIPKKLYLEENATEPQSPLGAGGECTVSSDACTIQVDAGEAKCVDEGKCTSGGGLFWTATADGSKVFFTDGNRLTSSSTAEPGEPDLYEYEAATGRLTDLTVAATGHADVGTVIGASEDGEYIYFQAGGALASNTTANGETASPERAIYGEGQNIYVLHDGVTSFITRTLGFEQEQFGNPIFDEYMSDFSRGPNYRTAQVSADGRTMMFESKHRLTNYDGTTIYDGKVVELYTYDASTGRISCASCDPTGAAQGPGGGDGEGLLPVAGGANKGGGGGWPSYGALRSMSVSGARVFFDTSNSLVPQDTNGLMDVYEWERPASGSEVNNSCSTSSESYSEVNGGCVFLLSGGQSTDASYFTDADAEGNNVFFASREKLTPQAGDENVAMYDARVDGGFPELSTACTGTGCQGVPPAPPIFATPSSATFNGVGNFEAQPAVVQKPVVKLARCKKGTVRKAARCVKVKGSGKRKGPGKNAKRRKK